MRPPASATAGQQLAVTARCRTEDRKVIAQVGGPRARSAARIAFRSSRSGGGEIRTRAARRSALPPDWSGRLGADRGDDDHRRRAGPRVLRADRPLAAAEDRQRACARPAAAPARRHRRTAGASRAVPILTGIEVDILEDGTPDQEPELLDRLDIVVASVHSKLAMDARDDPADGPGGVRRAGQRPRHCTAGWCPATAASGRSRSSTPRRCSPPAATTHRGGDQLPAGTARSADAAAQPGAGDRLCVLDRHRRTPQASWIFWATAPSAPSTPKCRRTGSLTPGPVIGRGVGGKR